MGGLDLIPDTASTDTAADRVIAEPRIGRCYQGRNTALITTLALDVQFRGDYLLCQQIGLILAAAVAHNRNRFSLREALAADHDVLQAPCLWMILPVAVAEYASAGCWSWRRR